MWLYDSQLRIIAERQFTVGGVPSVTNRFVYGSRTNTPEMMLRYAIPTATPVPYRIYSDHLGSPRLIVRAASPAARLLEMKYSAFGTPTIIGGSPIALLPMGYAGGLYDPDTGLVRFGARDYDPMVGRWVSKDPILFKGRQGNLYVYVGNDPINNRDPNGLFELFWSTDVDLISGESGEKNVGGVMNTETGDRGTFVSEGTGTGFNFGAGFGGGFASRDIGGFGWSLDVNFVLFSGSLLFDDKGLNGVLVAFGPGIGFSGSITKTSVTWSDSTRRCP
jgi:RHS repeat-associated protein